MTTLNKPGKQDRNEAHTFRKKNNKSSIKRHFVGLQRLQDEKM
jgi:hypothetical protein